jgi:hypothetical protein
MGKSHAQNLCAGVISCQNECEISFEVKPLCTSVRRGSNWMIRDNHRSDLKMVKSKKELMLAI